MYIKCPGTNGAVFAFQFNTCKLAELRNMSHNETNYKSFTFQKQPVNKNFDDSWGTAINFYQSALKKVAAWHAFIPFM